MSIVLFVEMCAKCAADGWMNRLHDAVADWVRSLCGDERSAAECLCASRDVSVKKRNSSGE